MADNIAAEWSALDQHELRILLDEVFGGPGQTDRVATGTKVFYLPLAGDGCKVALRYRGRGISQIEPGPAFDKAAWPTIRAYIDAQLREGEHKIGREFSFSSYRVLGTWRGNQTDVQILPPPEEAPIAPYEMGEHPFVLEFPLKQSDAAALTNYRRKRVHRQLTLLLNVLLAGRTNAQGRTDQHWAILRSVKDGKLETQWVQKGYGGNIGAAIVDRLSAPSNKKIEVLPIDAFATVSGIDGLPMRVPADLDTSICGYFALSQDDREKFDRAAVWLDVASREWPISISSSFGSLVSAIESMCDRGEQHPHECPKCGDECHHEVPGATENFRAFFEKNVPGESERKRRSDMYSLRSDIVHGTALMQMDLDRAFGWDPPGFNELELARELSQLCKRALRSWLRGRRVE